MLRCALVNTTWMSNTYYGVAFWLEQYCTTPPRANKNTSCIPVCPHSCMPQGCAVHAKWCTSQPRVRNVYPKISFEKIICLLHIYSILGSALKHWCNTLMCPNFQVHIKGAHKLNINGISIVYTPVMPKWAILNPWVFFELKMDNSIFGHDSFCLERRLRYFYHKIAAKEQINHISVLSDSATTSQIWYIW